MEYETYYEFMLRLESVTGLFKKSGYINFYNPLKSVIYSYSVYVYSNKKISTAQFKLFLTDYKSIITEIKNDQGKIKYYVKKYLFGKY